MFSYCVRRQSIYAFFYGTSLTLVSLRVGLHQLVGIGQSHHAGESSPLENRGSY